MMNQDDQTLQDIVRNIKSALNDDLVFAGELHQIVNDTIGRDATLAELAQTILGHLLAEGVEIGEALNPTGKYVMFRAWRGSIGERCARAFRALYAHDKHDRDFAFWLCLHGNVDEYEEVS